MSWLLLKFTHSTVTTISLFAEDYDYVKKYLREMAPLENSASIQDWSTGGKVFLDYITMVETIDEITQV